MFAHVDGILMASSLLEEHLHHLRLLFQQLSANGVVINTEKTEFGLQALEFLGQHLDNNGIHPLVNKVRAIEFSKPTLAMKLCQFLGVVNFYR